MKTYKLFYLLGAAVLAAGLLCACGQKAEPEPEELPGMLRDHSDAGAAKTVSSTEIERFECRFSTLSFQDLDALGQNVFEMDAARTDGAVQGSYRRRGEAERTLAAEAEFLARVQALAARYDLAQYNGLDREVSGLPDEYGAYLSIDYASGERIYARDNQDNFLPPALMEELDMLFRSYCTADVAQMDLSRRYDGETERVGNCIVSTQTPSLGAGYWDSLGRWHEREDSQALCEALLRYDDEVSAAREADLEALRAVAQEYGALPELALELYANSAVTVTRSDNLLLSFYERTEIYTGGVHEMRSLRAWNLDAETGRALGFDEVFMEAAALPGLLAQAFRAAYADMELDQDIEATIAASIQAGDGQVSFALSYGCVHVFAADYLLTSYTGGQQVTLSYTQYPDLVRPAYRALPERWLLEVESAELALPDGTALRCDWALGEPEENEGVWTLRAGAHTLEERFYGQRPECWLACTPEGNFLYLRIPAGDTSRRGRIYAADAAGVRSLGDTELTMSDTPNHNVERLRMDLDRPAYAGALWMRPYAYWRVGADGLPVSLTPGEYGLESVPMVLRETQRLWEAELERPARTDTFTTVAGGIELQPFRTDLEHYIDFLDLDIAGRAVRFEIDRYEEELRLGAFGPLDAVFAPRSTAEQTQRFEDLAGVWRAFGEEDTAWLEVDASGHCTAFYASGAVEAEGELRFEDGVYTLRDEDRGSGFSFTRESDTRLQVGSGELWVPYDRANG